MASLGRVFLLRAWFFIAIALFVIGGLDLSLAPLGFRVDWNISFEVEAMRGMFNGTDGFTAWNYANGGTPPFYPTLAPFLLLLTALSYVIPIVGLLERLLLVFLAVLAAYGMFSLLRSYRATKSWGPYVAALAYATGAYIFSKMCQGVLQEVLGYALLPYVAWAFLSATRAQGRMQRLAYASLCGMLIALAAVQPPFAVFAVLVVVISAVLLRAYGTAVIAIVVSILGVAYAILPLSANFHYISAVFASDTPLAEVHDWAPRLVDAIRQSGYNGGFDRDAVTGSGLFPLWFFAGIAIFFMSLAGAWSNGTRRAKMLFVGIVACAIAASLPRIWPQAYDFVMLHVPGAFVLRESYRFTALLAFGESVGLAMLCERTAGLSTWMVRVTLAAMIVALRVLFPTSPFPFLIAIPLAFGFDWIWRTVHVNLSTLTRERLMAVFAGIVVLLASPFFGVGMAAEIPQNAVPQSASAAWKAIANESGYGRMLYLPFVLPMRAVGSVPYGVDPTISWAPKPTIGNYLPLRIAKQFASALYNKNITQANMLSDWLNFRYVDARSWVEDGLWQNTAIGRTGRFQDSMFTTSTAESVLADLGFKQVQYVGEDAQERVYARSSADPSRVVSFDHLTVIDGDMRTATATYKHGAVDLFANQNSWATLEGILKLRPRVVVEGGEPYGLIASALPAKDVIEPGRVATQWQDDQDWGNMNAWNSWWWLDNAYISATEDTALVARIHSHTLTLPLHASGAAVLAVKYFAGPFTDWLRVSYGRNAITLHGHTTALNEGFRWATLRIADADPSDSVEITNAADGDGVVARIALVPVADWNASERRVRELLAHSPTTALLRPGVNRLFVPASGTYTIQQSCSKTANRALQIGTVSARSARVNLHSGDQPVRWVGNWQDCTHVLVANAHPLTSVAIAPLARTSSTAYEGSAKAPNSVAVLNTGYAPRWRASRRAIHFVADGYANGWIVQDAGALQITYGPKRLFVIGLGVSAGTLFVTFVLLYFAIFKSQHFRKSKESCQESVSAYQTETTPGF